MKRLKHIFGGIKGCLIVAFTFLIFPFARLFLWHRKIWIVSEHGYEARDNGYSFFKHMRLNHKEVNCYYAIKKHSSDYEKLVPLGNIINFGSLRHFFYFCAAHYIISSKTQGFCPSYYLTLLRKKIHLWGKYIFLQHGITKDDQKFLYKKEAKIDLFICGAKPEFEDIKAHYGYKEQEIAYTGFPRFDSYFNLAPKKQILIMPTWRRYTNVKDFKETDFFKKWYELINSIELNSLLKKYGFSLYFYMHPQFKDYISMFDTKCSNIIISPFNSSDLQMLIRESSLFITDFSSLAFDFGYMQRNVIYYQFDKEEYFKKHYIKGYFDYDRDGFGPVVEKISDVIKFLYKIFENKLNVDKKYNANSERFFPIRDSNNCQRIFELLINKKLKNNE